MMNLRIGDGLIYKCLYIVGRGTQPVATGGSDEK